MDLNKNMLAAEIKRKANVPQSAAEAAVDAFIETVKDCAMRGGKVVLRGFGTFSAKTTVERMGRNPRTGAPVVIPAAKTLKFKANGKL